MNPNLPFTSSPSFLATQNTSPSSTRQLFEVNLLPNANPLSQILQMLSTSQVDKGSPTDRPHLINRNSPAVVYMMPLPDALPILFTPLCFKVALWHPNQRRVSILSRPRSGTLHQRHLSLVVNSTGPEPRPSLCSKLSSCHFLAVWSYTVC